MAHSDRSVRVHDRRRSTVSTPGPTRDPASRNLISSTVPRTSPSAALTKLGHRPRTQSIRWRWMPVVVAAISGWSGFGGSAVSDQHLEEPVVECSDVGFVLLLWTQRGRRRAGRARRGRGRRCRGRGGRRRPRGGVLDITRACSQSEQATACEGGARHCTHLVFLLPCPPAIGRSGTSECLRTTESENAVGSPFRRRPPTRVRGYRRVAGPDRRLRPHATCSTGGGRSLRRSSCSLPSPWSTSVCVLSWRWTRW